MYDCECMCMYTYIHGTQRTTGLLASCKRHNRNQRFDLATAERPLAASNDIAGLTLTVSCAGVNTQRRTAAGEGASSKLVNATDGTSMAGSAGWPHLLVVLFHNLAHRHRV